MIFAQKYENIRINHNKINKMNQTEVYPLFI